MKTLMETWQDLIRLLACENGGTPVEDYLECRNVQVTFSADEAEEILCTEELRQNFAEMQKVFFTDEANRFGHSYASAARTPCEPSLGVCADMVQLLRQNSTTRKAVITYAPYGNGKIPCVNVIQFTVREGGLQITYFARGQDLFNKFPCDALCIIKMGREIANALDLELHSITACITSAHIYCADLDRARACCPDRSVPREILTGNASKYSAFASSLEQHGLSLLVRKLDAPEIQASDPRQIVEHKAKAAFQTLGRCVWVDEMCLVTDAFGNFPGAYTKDVFRLLSAEDLKRLFAGKSHGACMRCLMAFCDGRTCTVVEGENRGELDFDRAVENPAMPLNSLFVSPNSMAHRERALQQVYVRLNYAAPANAAVLGQSGAGSTHF